MCPQASAGYVAQVKYAWQHQPDAYISQANPVSGTPYPVLAATDDVRIISLSAAINWAANQPTPLQVIVTIDGVPTIFSVANPITATVYHDRSFAYETAAKQGLSTTEFMWYRAFLLEGQNVAVDAVITWPGPAQPTPLVCRVKWARLLPT